MVSARLVYVPGGTVTADSSDVSVCSRVRSTVTGAASNSTFPGLSRASVIVIRNESTLTPAGGVSVMDMVTGTVSAWPPPKCTLPPPLATGENASRNQ